MPAIHALRGITLQVRRGETLGLWGESGCGKSTVARAIPGLLPPSARIASGGIRFRGHDLAALSGKQRRRLRGAEIGLIFQDPAAALHPLMRIGSQVEDVARCVGGMGAAASRIAAERALEEVGLPAAEAASAYPHQLSGGERQRAAIARAIVLNPALLVADEPTSFLDSGVQAGLLRLLRRLTSERGLAALLISHNPMVLAAAADRIAVVYAGRIVECQPAAALFAHPLHPYTRALLACLPHAGGPSSTFAGIPGTAPDAAALLAGCLFAARCQARMEICPVQAPDMASCEGADFTSKASCWLYDR